MSPKIVDKEKRKKEIAQATLEVFAEKGFEATSMSQIAKLAGIPGRNSHALLHAQESHRSKRSNRFLP